MQFSTRGIPPDPLTTGFDAEYGLRTTQCKLGQHSVNSHLKFCCYGNAHDTYMCEWILETDRNVTLGLFDFIDLRSYNSHTHTTHALLHYQA